LTALVGVVAACLKEFNVKELNVTKELNVRSGAVTYP